jgi:hypothetical protein
LNPNESVEVINPTRPNTSAGEWTKVILRGIAVGTGLSYEVVARDYSQTTYSSSRTSQLEDRRRFRIIQKYIIRHLLQPVWDRFCDAASRTNLDGFPGPIDLLSDRRRFTPVEWQTPKWEWVDPGVEQVTSEAGINSFTATYSEVLGAQGLNFRTVFYQRAKENRLLKKLGLQTPEQTQLAISAAQTQGAAETQPATGSGEMMGLSTLQFNRNRKAIAKTLDELSSGAISEAAARVFLSSVGMSESSVQALIDDAKDGSVDTLPAEVTDNLLARSWVTTDDGNRLFLEGGELKTSPGGKSIAAPKPSNTNSKPSASPSSEKPKEFNKNPKTAGDVVGNIKQQINLDIKPIDNKIYSKGGRRYILVEGKFGQMFNTEGNKLRGLRFVEEVGVAGANTTVIYLKPQKAKA